MKRVLKAARELVFSGTHTAWVLATGFLILHEAS